MKQKLLVALIGILVLPPLGIMAVSQITKASLAHAQEFQYAVNGSGKVNTMMGTLDNDDANTMINMMKTHHGDDWKTGCNNMMDQLEKDST